MSEVGNRTPWVLCPVCWTPISFKGVHPYEVGRCENRYCVMADQHLAMHIFDTLEAATKFLKEKRTAVLQGPKGLRDFENKELGQWMVVTFKSPLDRFRMLEKRPLFKLLPEVLLKSWIVGAANTEGSDLFRIDAVAYDRRSGILRVDEDGYPDVKEMGFKQEEGLCPLRKLIHAKLEEKWKTEPTFPDPCLKCHKELAKNVIDHTRKHLGEMRLVTSDLNRKLKSEEIRNLSGVCWNGIVSVGLPILVCDVIVGIGVMGAKVVKNMGLTREQENVRKQILTELGIKQRSFKTLYKYAPVCANLRSLVRQKYWMRFRGHINELQNLAQSRYGQGISARTQILLDNILRWLHEDVTIGNLSSEQQVWKCVGVRIFSDLARFFSFKDLHVFGGEDKNSIRELVSVVNSKPAEPEATTFSVVGFRRERIDRELLMRSNLDPASDEKGSPIVISCDDSNWYVFGNRRFADGRSRESFNAVCVDLLSKSIRSLHAEMGRTIFVQRNLENVAAMAHNLKGPVAELGSAQALFDSVVHGTHNAKSTIVFRTEPWLGDSIEMFYDAVTAARRRVEFEARKLRYGRNIEQEFRRRR